MKYLLALVTTIGTLGQAWAQDFPRHVPKVNPGDIHPVILGITLPSSGQWYLICIALFFVYLIVSMSFWSYWAALGEDQFEDPQTRARMQLGVSVTPFGSRIRVSMERLAEPARSQARRILLVLDVFVWSLLAFAVLVQTIHFHFVL